jgi:GT2 family glycosyltransferase
MTPRFSIVVILYKCSPEKSLSLKSLLKINAAEFTLFIWDNSPVRVPEAVIMELKARKSEILYFHTPQNISLAKIYNNVCKMSQPNDFLLILDQDSGFDDNFFTLAGKAIKENSDVNLFVPYIEKNGKIFSPGNFYGVKGSYWKKLTLGKIKAQNKVAIASGMIIRMNYLLTKYPAFDQRLKLYGIDSDFVLQYAKDNEHFIVLEYNLTHNLSINEKESIDTKIFRFKDMRAATLIIARKHSIFRYTLAYVYVIYLSLKFMVQYRTLRFIKC